MVTCTFGGCCNGAQLRTAWISMLSRRCTVDDSCLWPLLLGPVLSAAWSNPKPGPPCLYNLCYACIVQCWGELKANLFCPHLQSQCEEKNLKKQIAGTHRNSQIAEYKDSKTRSIYVSNTKIKLKLFSKDDQRPLAWFAESPMVTGLSLCSWVEEPIQQN